MATISSIEWTDVTWNPVTGCTKVSQGCKHCYAERLAKRFWGIRDFTDVQLHEERIQQPLHWRQPRIVFVNSMSDLFHEQVPDEAIARIFDVMARSDRHTFQVLTKRSDRLRDMARSLRWPANVWVGVSIENSRVLHRVEDLRTVPAHVRFLSCEPLIGPLNGLRLKGIDWVIVGGESGPGARPMLRAWVDSIQKKCRTAGIPFFFKQWGGVHKAKRGRLLGGRTYDEMPRARRVNSDMEVA